MARHEQATGVYSNREIREALERGDIVIHPYVEGHVNGSSVDVTLGEWYYETDRHTDKPVLNPFDEEDVRSYFGEPKRARPHLEVVRELGLVAFKGIPDDHPIILLGPGERILAHTHEFIGIKPPGTTSMQARSTWGRLAIAVCQDAGWGDPGFISRWTMEIYNNNRRHAVPLPIGERVGQLVYFHTGPVDGDYSDLSGKYQNNRTRDELVGLWTPELMLPKAYKDKRELPRHIPGLGSLVETRPANG